MCIVGKKDAPVAIGNLERFAADYQRKHGRDVLPPKADAHRQEGGGGGLRSRRPDRGRRPDPEGP